MLKPALVRLAVSLGKHDTDAHRPISLMRLLPREPGRVAHARPREKRGTLKGLDKGGEIRAREFAICI